MDTLVLWLTSSVVPPRWFLATLRVWLVTEHSVMKVRYLWKLMTAFLAEFPRLLFVLHIWHVRAIPTYRLYRLCDKHSYEERVSQVVHGFFSPLIFSLSGGIGAIILPLLCINMLPPVLLLPRNKTSSTACSDNTELMLRSSTCIRGRRSSYHHPGQKRPGRQLTSSDLGAEYCNNIEH